MDGDVPSTIPSIPVDMIDAVAQPGSGQLWAAVHALRIARGLVANGQAACAAVKYPVLFVLKVESCLDVEIDS
jgi:hypothetical protein